MDSITNNFGEVLLWTFWFFIWITALMVWFRCIFDMFSDHTLSGWAKAGWSVLLIFVPWLGALIYLIVRGKSMGERQLNAATEQKAAQERGRQWGQTFHGGLLVSTACAAPSLGGVVPPHQDLWTVSGGTKDSRLAQAMRVR